MSDKQRMGQLYLIITMGRHEDTGEDASNSKYASFARTPGRFSNSFDDRPAPMCCDVIFFGCRCMCGPTGRSHTGGRSTQEFFICLFFVVAHLPSTVPVLLLLSQMGSAVLFPH